MIEYPTIPREVLLSRPIYAFDKLDGSNIRTEWTRKNGFSKFGSRRVLMDASHDLLGEAVSLFQRKYEESLPEIFKEERWDRVTCFFEYHSPNSFAGFHENESHDVTLLDVALHKKGLLPANEFIKIFKGIDTPRMLYYGNSNASLVQSVKDGTLEGMTFEGVVCKGIQNQRTYMFKIKTQAWLDKLHERFGHDEKLMKELL